jgi:CubicO group peptidase (beta-lactamase class C family)
MKAKLNLKYHLILFLIFLMTPSKGQQINHEMDALKNAISSGAYPNIDGIIVQASSSIVFEEYFNDYDRNSLHDTRSAFKSITSLLVGIAIDKGLIKLDDRISRYFPESKNQDTTNLYRELITLKDLLEMKAGFNCEEFYGIGPNCEDQMDAQDDWVEYALNVSMKNKPGINWSYNSIEPMLVGAIISSTTGLSIMDFAKENLFKPLGISDYQWTVSPKGQGMTAGSFFMKPIDMLKIGRLVKQNGSWKGKQIVSKKWLQQSTDCNIDINFSFTRYSRMHHAKYRSANYGFYWYKEQIETGEINTEVLFASGNGGQYIMLLDEYDAIVVFTGSNFNNWRSKLPFEILLKHLIPMLESKK